MCVCVCVRTAIIPAVGGEVLQTSFLYLHILSPAPLQLSVSVFFPPPSLKHCVKEIARSQRKTDFNFQQQAFHTWLAALGAA